MSGIADLAAILKERKGIVPIAPEDAAPEPAATDAPEVPSRKGGRRRYSPGKQYARRLEGQISAANMRADKAEAKLAALRAEVDGLLKKNREIKSLRAEAEARLADVEGELAAVEKVEQTNAKVWRLNQEIARLRGIQALHAEIRHDAKEVERLKAELLAKGRANQSLGGHIQKLEMALVRLRERFDAENPGVKAELTSLRRQIKERDAELRKLHDAAKDRGVPGRRIAALWLRVEALEAENERLRTKT